MPKGSMIWIVGHERKRMGAYSPILGWEYEFNLKVARKAHAIAKARGYRTEIVLRDGGDVYIVGRRADEIARADGDFDAVVELHFNGFNGQARGSETLYDADPPESAELARVVHEHMCKALERPAHLDRGLKYRLPGERGYENLRAVTAAGCLVEPVFGDNEEDANLMVRRLDAYARALVDGCEEFLLLRAKAAAKPLT